MRRDTPPKGGETPSLDPSSPIARTTEGPLGIAKARSDDDPRAATRRDFLKLAGVALGAAVLPETLSACAVDAETARSRTALVDGALSIDTTIDVLRPEDLLTLRFELINLGSSDGATLTKLRPAEKSFVVVTFPPQHIAEPATPWANGAPTAPEPSLPIDVRSAGPSRLAFEATAPLPYSLEPLLAALTRLRLSLPPNTLPPVYEILPARAPPPPIVDPAALLSTRARASADALATTRLEGPRPPSDMAGLSLSDFPLAPLAPPAAHETAIELPYRLQIAPHMGCGFTHSPSPYVPPQASRVEIWSSRLGIRTDAGGVDDGRGLFRAVRAVWSPDVTTPIDPPWPAHALTAAQRARIVHQSADFTTLVDAAGKPLMPAPAHVRRMMLTALGGSIDAHADFGEYGSIASGDLVDWAQLTSHGRDQAVRVVRKGYLSLGHKAALVTLSERRFSAPEGPGGQRIAYLYQRTFIVVEQPLLSYDSKEVVGPWRRQLPLRTLQITTLSTPDLDPHTGPEDFFFPFVDGKPFLFGCDATDVEGNPLRFDVAAMWIPETTRSWEPSIAVETAMFGGDRISKARMAKQRVAVASASAPGSTALDVTSLTFGLKMGRGGFVEVPPNEFALFPVIDELDATIPAIARLTGSTDTRAFVFPAGYLENEFLASANPAEAFLVLKDMSNPFQAAFGKQSDKTGGFLSPSMAIKALSRKVGPLGGDTLPLDLPTAGSISPDVLFGGVERALIFGAIPLSSILSPGLLENVAPKFVTEVYDQIEAFFAVAARLTQAGQILSDAVTNAQAVGVEKVRDEVLSVVQAKDALVAAVQVVLVDFQSGEEGLLKLPADLNAVVTAAKGLAAALHVARLVQGPLGVVASTLTAIEGTVTDLLAYLAAIDEVVAEAKELLGAAERAKNLTARIEWRPDIQASPNGLFRPTGSDKKILLLSAEMRAKQVGTKKAGVDLLCSIENFSINLFGASPCVVIAFTKVQFKMEAGKKPDVDVVFESIDFHGPLEFVNTLKTIIPFDGFSDPPALEVDTSGITASFSIGLPNLAIGIMSVENISLGGNLKIPFIGGPLSVGLQFCSRENPFRLTVGFLGGGGFFGMALGMDGIQLIEAAFEFGASVSLNLVVASGSVSIMAGIYFRKEGSDVTLAGYVRIRGEMDVLGLISVAVEMRLELGYKAGNAYGIAEISLEISIAFFSKSVSVTCEKTFCGSNGDPTFAQLMAPSLSYRPWDEYCHAFA